MLCYENYLHFMLNLIFTTNLLISNKHLINESETFD
jgi:hypothetical protein